MSDMTPARLRETITRTRRSPGGYDRYGDPIESTADTIKIQVGAIAPGTSKEYAEHGRDGETIEHTLYFRRAVDIADGDEIEVRGATYKARVAEWRSPYGTGRRATVVEATRETG